MKQRREIDEKIAETLNSLDGIERATPGHFFFTRLQTRLKRDDTDIWEKIGGFLARPVFVIASIMFIIAINIIVVYREMPPTASFADQNEQVFDDEYNMGVAGIYEYENQER